MINNLSNNDAINVLEIGIGLSYMHIVIASPSKPGRIYLQLAIIPARVMIRPFDRNILFDNWAELIQMERKYGLPE